MKSIVRLKLSLWSCFLSVCLTEGFMASKANITQVKLFHINPRNISLGTRKSESLFGSRAKISKVVPIKHITKVGPRNFRNSSIANSHNGKKNSFQGVEKVLSFKSHFMSPNKTLVNSTKAKYKSDHETKLTVINLSTNTTTVLPKAVSSSTTRNPLFLTSDSYNYLKSDDVADDEQQIINGLWNEVVNNVSIITKRDPVSGQNFPQNSIINGMGNVKQSRMLPLDNDLSSINTGVRFSAKQRKPVLNVKPLKDILGKPVKNLIKPATVEQWNTSGIISNQNPLNSTMKSTPNQETYQNGSITSPLFTAGSTMPSLLQVLAIPEHLTFDSTTFSPFLPSQSKRGFVPVIPTDSVPVMDFKPFMYKEKDKQIQVEMLQENSSGRSNPSSILLGDASTVTARKPRVPPKEDEYLLPSITSTSTISPEVNKGYQTILESTTPGPKVIWYHHNQTPQDTFYPNSDNFLVPPEESSIEILTDLLSVQHVEDVPSLDTKLPFSPASSELTFKYNNRDSSKIKGHRKEVGAGNVKRGNRGSHFSIEKDNKKPKKIVSLQQSATTNHDAIRDYYDDLDSKNGGIGERNVYYHHKGKRYGIESYNDYGNDIKYHEIIPRHQSTNRKPSYSEDDTESYGAFNEDDHYRDSYPPPSVANRHEISPHRYRSYHDEESPNENYLKDEPIRGYDGRFREEGPSSDVGLYNRKEPKYRLKESPPGWGHHGAGPGNHGHGWKGPSKDFFSHAKDYFKNSDFSTAEKWFDASIGVLAFLAFGGYIIMLLYQVFAMSTRTPIGTLIGRSVRGAGEIFDLFFSKGPIGQAYLDELEGIVKRAMANVKRIWMTNSFADKTVPQVKGEMDAK